MDKELSIKVESRVHQIANFISRNTCKDDIGLLSGVSGEILFLSYYARFYERDDLYEKIGEKLEFVFDQLEAQPYPATFSRGITGINWMLEHLNKNDILEFDMPSTYESTDELLYQHMMAFINNDKYDYLHGALGIASYFANRDTPQTTEYLNSFLEVFLTKFEENTESGSIYIKSKVYSSGEYIDAINFSLSHGMTSIVYFLDKCLTNLTLENEQTISEHLNKIILFLNENQNDLEKTNSTYPSWLSEHGSIYNSRLSWCYGDLSMGYVLHNLKSRNFEGKYSEDALNILDRTRGRLNPVIEEVKDSAICHGASGLALIYSKVYDSTQKDKYKTTAEYWLNHVLNDNQHEEGICGYQSNMGRKIGWSSETGLLEGITGIGLSLLSQLDDNNKGWEELLML